MRHDIVIEGPAYRLRPVGLEDAGFIHGLRADRERARYLRAGSGSLEEQKRWIEDYFERPNDYYFVIEARASASAEGAIGIYNVDPEERCAEWGRWIVRAGSLAAVESVCLIYRIGFEVLDLKWIYCRTAAENSSTLAFHDSFGLERARVLPRYVELDGRWVDAVEDRLTRPLWESIRERAEGKAERAASWSLRV